MGHLVDRGLVGEEVAAVDGLVEVLVLGVTLLARDLVARVDSALGAHRVAAFHRDQRKEVHRDAALGDADGGGEAGESAADHDDASVGILHVRPLRNR